MGGHVLRDTCAFAHFVVAGYLTPFHPPPLSCLYDWGFTGFKVTYIRSILLHSWRKSKHWAARVYAAICEACTTTQWVWFFISCLGGYLPVSFGVEITRHCSAATWDPALALSWSEKLPRAAGKREEGSWRTEEPVHLMAMHFGTGYRATCCF